MEALQVCINCRESKPLEAYYKHSEMANGHLGKCKECVKSYTRRHYWETLSQHASYERSRFQRPERKIQIIGYQRKRRLLNPEKYKANSMVGNAIRDGRLKRQPCETCGDIKTQAHHDDYLKPLDVRWLCRPCHFYIHGKQSISRSEVT